MIGGPADGVANFLETIRVLLPTLMSCLGLGLLAVTSK